MLTIKPGHGHRMMDQDSIVMDIEFDEEYKEVLRRCVKFSSLVYAPYFIMTSLWANASYNDSEFFKLLHKYTQVDTELADVANGAMQRHLFYLTEEMVVKSLFSKRLGEDEKSRMDCRLLSCPKPGSFKVEKPKPPTLD
jgi:hypothetical protein